MAVRLAQDSQVSPHVWEQQEALGPSGLYIPPLWGVGEHISSLGLGGWRPGCWG